MVRQNISTAYDVKEGDYFDRVRKDIFSLLPLQSERIIELGCGTGATLKHLKDTGRCTWACGIEQHHDAAEIARLTLDCVIEGDIEKIELPVGTASIDVVLCLDVLEHLVDPWTVVHKLDRLLRPGGVIIASIPNVRNLQVLLPLMIRGKWNYTDAGILDRTHLRFFTRDTALQLMECSGLKVDSVTASNLKGWRPSTVANYLTLSLFRPLLEYAYLIRARKSK